MSASQAVQCSNPCFRNVAGRSGSRVCSLEHSLSMGWYGSQQTRGVYWSISIKDNADIMRGRHTNHNLESLILQVTTATSVGH